MINLFIPEVFTNYKHLEDKLYQIIGIRLGIDWISKPKTSIIIENSISGKKPLCIGDYIVRQYFIGYDAEKQSFSRSVLVPFHDLDSVDIDPKALAIHVKNKSEIVPRSLANAEIGYGTLIVFWNRIIEIAERINKIKAH